MMQGDMVRSDWLRPILNAGQDYYIVPDPPARPSRSVHPNIIGAGRVWLARLVITQLLLILQPFSNKTSKTTPIN